MIAPSKNDLAYIIGVALGDGNLSSPNGRATRLRVTCDAKYPILAQEIIDVLKRVFPSNSVSVVITPKKSTYFNISVYSNKLNEYMPWKVGRGTKHAQGARVPEWIRIRKRFSKLCLKGLIQTDGSIYRDRGYLMINFTNQTKELADDVLQMLKFIGFSPTMGKTIVKSGGFKYCVRIARDSEKLIKTLKLTKS
jgi:DNA-binding transcriptional regulator WhiA